ncbi:MAG TPA: DUF4252 domain-containing protein [Candidatus Sulfopaludibacter sp.]|jgi:hypothetical protein|nr:DUF4252 domain-containing protein [Candidatus Sulfopaludibacter sp.]
MKRARKLVLLGSLASILWAQQFKFNLDHLTAKASNVVDISLGGPLLQLGARFLDSKDPDQAAVKKMVAGLEGIYVKSFTFNMPGVWTMADLDAVRSQLKSPEWMKMVGYTSSADGENAEIYMRMEDKKINGVAVLVSGPKELTVVNIAGPVDLESLAALGGHFGVPKLVPPPRKK